MRRGRPPLFHAPQLHFQLSNGVGRPLFRRIGTVRAVFERHAVPVFFSFLFDYISLCSSSNSRGGLSSHKSRLRANQKARQPIEKPQSRQNKQRGFDITYHLINNSIDPRQPEVGLGGPFETKLGRAADGGHGSLALRGRVGGAARAEGARAKDLFDERVEAGDAGADEDAGAFDAVV